MNLGLGLRRNLNKAVVGVGVWGGGQN